MGFDRGYVAYDFWGNAWYAADGTDWTQVQIEGQPSSCDSVEDAWEYRIQLASSNGGSVLLAGLERDDASLTGARAATWLSADGQRWDASPTFESSTTIFGLWSVNDGWDALLGVTERLDEDIAVTLWHSNDGQDWQPRSDVLWHTHAIDASLTSYAYGSAPDGQRILATAHVGGGAVDPDGPFVFGDPIVMTSNDPTEWDLLDLPFLSSGDLFVSQVLGPAQTGDAWMLVTHDRYLSHATIWTSPDLQTWSSHEVPLRFVAQLVPTTDGLVLSACQQGRRCAQYLSTDGSDWREITPHLLGEASIVDGPQGTLLIGRASGRVWHLDVAKSGNTDSGLK